MSRQTLAAVALCLLAACGGATPKELAKQADDALTAGKPAEAQKLARKP
jgi:outer membrane biogenesis lipoprotein LolB